MTIDKYTKFILTLIAVGILGLNFYLFGQDKVNLISEAKAEVAGMSYYDLKRDRDFKKAVRYIVEDCRISASGRRIRC